MKNVSTPLWSAIMAFTLSVLFVGSVLANEQIRFKGEIIENPDRPLLSSENASLFSLSNPTFSEKAGNPDYKWQFPSLNSLRINTIEYLDNNLVFAAGEFGLIMKSTDGGQTWLNIENSFSETIFAMDIKGNKIIICGNNGFIGISEDAGLTWNALTSNVTTSLRSIKFGKNNHIYASGAAKTSIFSNDGGNTWQTLTIPNAVVFNPNNKTDWMYRSIVTRGDSLFVSVDGTGMPVQVLRSINNGTAWETSVATGINTPGGSIGIGVTDISMAGDGLVAYACYRSGLAGGMIKTIDGGASWARVENLGSFAPLPNPEVPYTSTTVQMMDVINVSQDGLKIITAGLFGQVLASIDGGNNWYEIYGGVKQGNRDFFSVGFSGLSISPDGNSWLVGGSRGIIAGASGFAAATASLRNGDDKVKTFMDVSFFDDNNGIAVGFETVQKYLDAAGTIGDFAVAVYYTTQNGGQTWDRVTGPGKDDYRWYSLQTSANGKIWVAGMKLVGSNVVGVISYSDNFGNTWTEQTLLAGEEFYKIRKWDDNTLYAITFTNKFAKTQNGSTWQISTVPSPAEATNPLMGIDLTSSNTVYVSGGKTSSGGKAFIMKSMDGGETWSSAFNSGTNTGRVSEIRFIDARFGFAGGLWGPTLSRKVVLHTSDYGNTWTEGTAAFDGVNSSEIAYIIPIDSVKAMAYGANGQAIVTQNGLNYTSISPRFANHTIYGGYRKNANEIWVGGASSSILKFDPVNTQNTAPNKFANLIPAPNASFTLSNLDNMVSWTASSDPDGDIITYSLIIENPTGSEVIAQVNQITDAQIALNTTLLPNMETGNYRWRVEASDENGLTSTTEPTFVQIIVEGFINTQNDIVSFVLPEQSRPAIINTENHTLDAEVVYGTSLLALTPEIQVSLDATIDPESGVTQDFSAPVIYTVTAQSGDAQQWTVTVSVQTPVDNITMTNFTQFGYSKIPVSQLTDILFMADATNNGNRNVTNLTLEVKANNQAIGQSAPLAILETGNTATLNLQMPISIANAGSYNFAYEFSIAEPDANLINHTAQTQLNASDSVYATDNGNIAGGVGSNTAPITFGNVYQIKNPAHLTTVTIGWPNFNQETSFTISVKKINMETLAVIQDVYTSPVLNKTLSMANTFATFNIDNIWLEEGYYAILVNQTTATNIGLGFDAQANGGFYLFSPQTNALEFFSNPQFGNAAIRANLGTVIISNDATLSSLLVNNALIADFNPETLSYQYALPAGTTETPEVTAIANHPSASISIQPATNINSENPAERTTFIQVTAADLQTTLAYSVEFNVASQSPSMGTPSVKLFPNPVRNKLNIQSDEWKQFSIQICTLDGKTMISEDFKGNSFVIDLSDLPIGLYIVRLSTDSNQSVYKISVVK